MNSDSDFDPFEILGVTRGATDQEIKKAYRKLSRTCHPDIVGNDNVEAIDLFQKLTKSKDILLDNDTKAAYLRGGWDLVDRLKAVKSMNEQRVAQLPPIMVEKRVTLEQLYNQATVAIDTDVHVVSDDKTETIEKFHYDIELRPGICNARCVIEHKGNRAPDHIPGDIVISIQLEESSSNSNIVVKGVDLIYIARIDLVDILRPYQIVIPHPNGECLLVKGTYKLNDEEDDNIFIYEGLGLPNDTGSHGNLVVQVTFNLDTLTQLSPESKAAIIKILDDQSEQTPTPNDTKDITAQGLAPSDMRRKQQRNMPPDLAAMMAGMQGMQGMSGMGFPGMRGMPVHEMQGLPPDLAAAGAQECTIS